MSRLTILAALLVCSSGCVYANSQIGSGPMISESRWPEKIALPPDASAEPLPDGIPEGDWAEPAVCGGKEGVCISPAKAARLALVFESYKTLRKRFESDRQVWRTHRTAYEGQLEVDRRTIEALQPTWWSRNKLWIGFLGGLVLGTGSAAVILHLSR